MPKRASSPSASSSSDSVPLLCVLTGGDGMLKREKLDALRETILKKHPEVQTIVYDGREASLAGVLDELRSFGLMQQHKIVIVDEADAFVTAHRDALERYAANPVDNATLVFRSVKWNKGNLDKLIAAHGFVFKADPLPAPAAAAWAVARAAGKHQRKLDPSAASFLVQRLGADLGKIDAELAKLALLVEPAEPIGKKLIEEVVGKGSDEEVWAVQEAVLRALEGALAPAPTPRPAAPNKSAAALLAKVHELTDLADHPPEVIAYFIADIVRKLHVGLLMKKQGAGESAIAKDLKLWGHRQEMFMGLIRKLDTRRTAELFDRIVDLDLRSKSSRGTPLLNIECFCASLADNP